MACISAHCWPQRLASGPFGIQPSKWRPARSRLAGSAPAIHHGGPPGRCGVGPRRALDLPASVPRHRLAGPQRAAQLHAFEQPPDALLERHARGHELGADVGNVGGDADAQDHAPLRDLVERGDLLRQHDGIAQGRQQHRGAELDARHAGGHGREQGQRIVPRPRQQRIADPDRVEPEARRAFGQLQQGHRLRPPRHGLLAGRQQVSNARRHGGPPGRFLWASDDSGEWE